MKNIYQGSAGCGKVGFFITLAAVVSMIVFFLVLPSETQKTIKVGGIIPLSGPASQHKVVLDAIRLATEEINSSGGINGRKLELIIADSKTNSKEGQKAFRNMEKTHRPLLYISTTTVVSMALAPLAEKAQVVLAGLVVSNPTLTKQKQWVFRYFVSSEQEAKPIMHILEKLGVKKLGILYQNDGFGTSNHAVLKASFEKAGGSVLSVPFEAKSPDFATKTPILKNTEAIYIAGFVNIIGQAIERLRVDKYKGFVLSHSGSTSLLHSLPVINDIYVAAPIIYNPSYVFAREAQEKYEARYKSFFTHQSANGYDFIKMLAGLLEGQELSRGNVRKLLESEFSYPGILGYIEKKEGEHDIHFPLYPARIVNGKVHYLQ